MRRSDESSSRIAIAYLKRTSVDIPRWRGHQWPRTTRSLEQSSTSLVGACHMNNAESASPQAMNWKRFTAYAVPQLCRGIHQLHYSSVILGGVFSTVALIVGGPAQAADRINIINYGPGGAPVDRTGSVDVSQALANAIAAANVFTAKGEPACIYVPPGIYRIVTPPPPFARAGCVIGDGPSQSIINVDLHFAGDLFSWSEAWFATTSGPTV